MTECWKSARSRHRHRGSARRPPPRSQPLEEDFVLQRAAVPGPHALHGLFRQALQFLDLAGMKFDPCDSFHLVQCCSLFRSSDSTVSESRIVPAPTSPGRQFWCPTLEAATARQPEQLTTASATCASRVRCSEYRRRQIMKLARRSMSSSSALVIRLAALGLSPAMLRAEITLDDSRRPGDCHLRLQ
jgi:hypothetical protein